MSHLNQLKIGTKLLHKSSDTSIKKGVLNMPTNVNSTIHAYFPRCLANQAVQIAGGDQYHKCEKWGRGGCDSCALSFPSTSVVSTLISIHCEQHILIGDSIGDLVY